MFDGLGTKITGIFDELHREFKMDFFKYFFGRILWRWRSLIAINGNWLTISAPVAFNSFITQYIEHRNFAYLVRIVLILPQNIQKMQWHEPPPIMNLKTRSKLSINPPHHLSKDSKFNFQHLSNGFQKKYINERDN